jgi:hypothetical protein
MMVSFPPPPPGNIETEIHLPKYYELDQNYPNPFNPTTTVRYQLPFDSHVRLSVCNLLGQVVLTLIDGAENVGYKQVGLDAGALSSGIYFYRLDATALADPSKHVTSIKKMLLVK